MRKWLAVGVGLNLVLGLPGVVPMWLVWYWMVNWPLAGLGWTRGEPTENDGMLPWFIVATPVLVLFGLVWWAANRPVRRRAGVSGRLYWSVGAVATFAPTGALFVWSVVRG